MKVTQNKINIVKYTWLLIVLILCIEYLFNRTLFGISDFTLFLKEHYKHAWFIFLAASCLRSLVFIPSTIIIIAGTLVFKDQLHWVYLVSMLGIFISTYLNLIIADIWSIDDQLSKKYNAYFEKYNFLKHKETKIFLVVLWSFAPFTPTDAICWVRRMLNLSKNNILIGILIGESVIVAFYVYGVDGLIRLLF